jgi:hypothetical protein
LIQEFRWEQAERVLAELAADESIEGRIRYEAAKLLVGQRCAKIKPSVPGASLRLANIEKTSKRPGRKDWLMASVGAVFSLVLADLIGRAVAQRIRLMLVEGLGHMFGLGGPPAQLP